MATFTRDWDEANPTDSTNAVDIDDYNRYLRVDVSDRIKAMVYGFTAGENDGVPGLKKLTFKQQAAAPSTPAANIIELYCIDDGSDAGLYAIQEDGYTKQILKKSGSSLILNVGNTDGVVATTGDQSITGAKTFANLIVAALTASANLDIGAFNFRALTLQSDQATGTAPLTVASTTKVTNLNADKVDGYDISAYAGGESYTFPGGLILKMGYVARSGTGATVTFAAAFPNAIVSAGCKDYYNGSTASNYGSHLSAYSTTGLTIVDSYSTWTGYLWWAIGR